MGPHLPTSKTHDGADKGSVQNGAQVFEDDGKVTGDHSTEHAKPTNSLHGSSVADPASVQEGGRTFQNYRHGKYYMPNDAVEQERLDMNHVAFTMLLDDQLHLAPLENVRRVLDIGTGTGIWAIDFAKQNPEATVIGTDLTLIQPPVSVPNVHFVREDMEDEWVHDEPFDLIHLRLVFSFMSNPRTMMKKIYDNLNPGGWVEFHDSAFSIDSIDGSHLGTAFHQWSYLARAGAAAKGRDLDVVSNYKDYLLEAGFVDVTEKKLKLCGNTWPTNARDKFIGEYMLSSGSQVVQTVTPKLLGEGLSWPAGDVDDLVQRALADMRNEKMKFYWPLYVVYGRKPVLEE